MATRRRMDGFSEDGLSYSVASDFDKQIGQALAAQEARLRDPRFIPGARVESPDAPDILERELIDPVLTAFGMTPLENRSRGGRVASSPVRTFEMGNQLISHDPVSGQTRVVHTQPPKPAAETKYQIPTGLDILGKPTTTASLTLPDIVSLAPTLPDQIRTNAPVASLLEMAKQRGGPVKPGQVGRKTLTRELAQEFKSRAGGDKDLARRLAREAGYEF